MKYVVCVPDGAADDPIPELGGRTPLEVAHMPNLTKLAARGEVGRAATIPEGMPPGSDVGNLSILGYDPAVHHTGRAPIEAAAMGLRLRPDQIAYRCNLATVDADGTMVDFAGGHPSTEEAAAVIATLQAELGDDDISFHPGVQYRHILITPNTWADADCFPPHDLTGQPAVWPTGPDAPKLQALMDASQAIVGASDLAATQIWLWGQGPQPVLPSFQDTYGLTAELVSAVDLIRGLGVLTGIPAADVEGITGWYDTNYEGKRDACLDALAAGTDLFLIHVEASDEAGHAGNLEAKIEALENWDRRIIGPLIDGLDGLGPWRLLLLPDHPTPVALRTHTSDSVPYLLVDSAVDGPGGTYSEAGTASSPPVPGHLLMSRLLGRTPTEN
jgi:2,3-bisphosphoglycerate-independent phosphoglycerate mutase